MVLRWCRFIGAIGVWVPTCVYILLYGSVSSTDKRCTRKLHVALALFIYCGLVVSTVDNILSRYILHGQSNLHPLLALFEHLRWLHCDGPVGILLAMLVSFLQALLQISIGTGPIPRPGRPNPRHASTSVAAAAGTNGGAAALLCQRRQPQRRAPRSQPPSKKKRR